MSSVNRNDRLSRRILGFNGLLTALQAQNAALAERVKVLEAEVKGANAVVADLISRLNTAEALFIAKAEPLPGFTDAPPLASETAAEAVAAIPATQD